MNVPDAVIETSAQGNLEVNAPITSTDTSSDMDWASRLDSQFEQINEDTGDTKYGKVDEPKSELDEKLTRAEKQAEKNKAATEKKDKKISSKSKKSSESTPEEPKDETPKTETDAGEKTEESEETPKGITEKAAVKWGELRNENRTYKKQVEELKAEVEKLKSTPAVDSSELEQLRRINSEYEQELSVARVEATQEYKQNVYEPMVNVVGYLNGLAQRYELNSKDMLAAFSEADPAKQSDMVADLAASMNERDRLRFYAANDDYNEIIRRRDYYQTSSRDRMAQIEQQRQSELARQQEESQKTTAQVKEAYDKATSKVFEDLKKQVPVLSDAEVAADVQRLAKGDYSNANPELKSYLAHSGALLPHLLKSLREAQANLEKANKTIAGYRNSSPKAGGGSADLSKNVGEDVGFLEALEQQLR